MSAQPGVPAPRWIVYVRLGDLRPYPGNPKSHDIALIVESIRRHGFADPVEVCDRTGYIASGHGRVDALHTLRTTGYAGTPDGIILDDDGEWCVPVQRGWASKDDAHLRAYIVQANRAGEVGGWDKPLLAEMLHSIATGPDPELFDDLGFTGDDMDDLLGTVDPDLMDQGPEGDPDTTTGDNEQQARPDPLVGCPHCGSTFRQSESELSR